jgi:hypothetical protein
MNRLYGLIPIINLADKLIIHLFSVPDDDLWGRNVHLFLIKALLVIQVVSRY